MLSYLTSDNTFYDLALKSLEKLWSLRSDLNLMGNSFDLKSKTWNNNNAGIGSGIDSFYEYLFKAYMLFGNSEFLDMYDVAYKAVNKWLKNGDWYVEADMNSGRQTHIHFNSLQAFWPVLFLYYFCVISQGLQVLTGDLESARLTHKTFYSVWSRYGVLPERFLLQNMDIHPSERYYPLRPGIAVF